MPETRRPSQVVAGNIRIHRVRKDLSHDQVAERMSSLEHAWTPEDVAAAEDGVRNLNVDELLGIALVLGVSLGDLLDPTLDRDDSETLHFGGPEPLWGGFARLWVRQQIRAELLWLDWQRDLFFYPGDDVRLENASAINAEWLRRRRT